MTEEKVIIHPETGESLTRGIKPFRVYYGNLEEYVNMPGWWNEAGNDGIFSQEDLKVSGKVFRRLKAEYERRHQAPSYDGTIVEERVAV